MRNLLTKKNWNKHGGCFWVLCGTPREVLVKIKLINCILDRPTVVCIHISITPGPPLPSPTLWSAIINGLSKFRQSTVRDFTISSYWQDVCLVSRPCRRHENSLHLQQGSSASVMANEYIQLCKLNAWYQLNPNPITSYILLQVNRWHERDQLTREWLGRTA